jgi:ribose transport system substrate-binding protein
LKEWNHHRTERRGVSRVNAATALVCLLGSFLLVPETSTFGQEGPQGLVVPSVLPPFDPNAPPCAPPPGLKKILVFAQDNERQFMQGVRYGLGMAAKDRQLAFEVLLASDDPTRMIDQVRESLSRSVGAVVAAPVDPPSLAVHLQHLIWSGAFVGTVVPPPAITILNAPQYLTGKVLAEAAANYIRTRLGGKAKVVLLTHDSLQFLGPRFAAMRDALREIPGVTIVADISPVTVNETGGQATMETILLAQPNVDMVLGADTVVLGALAALRAAGKARDDQFLGGIDGEPKAVAEIKKGGPYKASISLASPVFGYALGQFAADWLEGKSVPQAMDVLPKALTSENIAAYEADQRDPAAVFADAERRTSYLKMYGNICYDTRDRYVNFPWSSEIR